MTASDPYRYFRIEARELLESLQRGIAELEAGPANPDRFALLLRFAHTLKGAARVVKLPAVSDEAHRLEGVLAACRDAAAAPVPAQREELRRSLQAIAAVLAGIDRPVSPTGEASGAGRPISPATAQALTPLLFDTVKRQIAEVDAALAGVASTAAEVEGLRNETRALERAAQQARVAAALAARSLSAKTAVATLSRLRIEADELAESLEGVRHRVGNRMDRVARDLRRLHDETSRLSLIPTAALWSFLARAASDAAQMLGKRVRLGTDSRTPRLDANVFAALQEALLHAVRNAVAHGIEPAPLRRDRGKPPEGGIRISIQRSPTQLRVTCEDDGGGIDLDAVRRAALKRGLLTPAAAASFEMGDAVQLLLHGRLSTTAAATEMSGRGVGLDAVRAAAARVGGTVTLESVAGRGTTLTLEMPLTLSAMEALRVEVGGTHVLLPLDAVRRVLRIEAGAIHASAQGEQLHVDDTALPFAPLHRLLRQPAASTAAPTPRLTVLIVHNEGDEVALGVDRLGGVVEVVVRPLPALADASPIIAGASLGPTGLPHLVLNPGTLAAAIRDPDFHAPIETPAAPAPILVVDDSLTTRMLEQSILESAGYRVDLAVSGEDALRRLRQQRYGLLLVDIEMPGMDGFTLVERLRSDETWKDIPVILVTSRDSGHDRQRGLEAGAQEYVIKGEFDQRRLLRCIEELLS